MSESLSGQQILAGIRATTRPKDDTLYISPEHKNELLRAMDGSLTHGRADTLQIHGLQVETRPEFRWPIVCQKGQVFTIAEDFKSGRKF